MEVDGGCLMEYGRYDGPSKVDRIMQRFRLIAPKPPDSGSVSTGKSESISGRGKSERKSNPTRKRKVSSETCKPRSPAILPQPSVWVNPDGRTACGVVGSCVTVERIGDVWGGSPYAAVFIGQTDEERRLALEKDTCPCFLTDVTGRVVWTNAAYRRMADVSGKNVVSVWLANKETAFAVAGTMCNFTCKVRVDFVNTVTRPLTAPCDVWRLETGDLAWRLDVDATLSLGR